MAVTVNRVGNTLTVTVTQDVADLVANTNASKDDKIATALGRVVDQVQKQAAAHRGEAADMSRRIAELQAEAAKLPAKITTF